MQALNALLFPVTTNLDEDGGESPAQKAFICSGCVSVLIEAVTNAPSHQSTIGEGFYPLKYGNLHLETYHLIDTTKKHRNGVNLLT